MAQYVYTMNQVGKIVPPKRRILEDISLSFFPGAKIGVLGLNGSGKSTLLRIMAGEDKDIEGEARAQAGINVGYLSQEPALDPDKDVRGNVEEGLGEALGEMEAEILDDDLTLEPEDVALGLKDYVAGAVVYVHVGFNDFFVDAEYMTALDEFDIAGIVAGEACEEKGVDEPAVWNVEVGYNLDWGKNLEIVLKYAGSDEAGFLGFPEERYGICLNQELYKDVIASLGYLNDDFEKDDADDRDGRDLVFAQIAIEF